MATLRQICREVFDEYSSDLSTVDDIRLGNDLTEVKSSLIERISQSTNGEIPVEEKQRIISVIRSGNVRTVAQVISLNK